MKRRVKIKIILLTLLSIALGACSKLSVVDLSSNNPSTNNSRGGTGSGGSPVKNVLVSWNPNHEKAVNILGGGYRVYYSTQSGFTIVGATSVNVPYVSGPSAPLSAVIPNLASGTYYIKVLAYSAANPTGAASGQSVVTVP